MKTDTPNTDEHLAEQLRVNHTYSVSPDFARELERELNDQVVCNGKGAEREAALLGKVEMLEREIAGLRGCGSALRDALAFEGVKIGDLFREIKEWDALMSTLPNVKAAIAHK